MKTYRTDRDRLDAKESRLATKLVKHFDFIRNEVVDLASRVVVKDANTNIIEYIVGIVGNQIVFDIEEAAKDVYVDESQRLQEAINLSIGFEAVNKGAETYLAERDEIIKKINNTTKSEIARILERAIQGEATQEDLIEQLRGSYALSRNRAEMIASNELGEAYVQGTNRTAQRLAVENDVVFEKQWDNVGDSNVTQGCTHNETLGWKPQEFEFPNIDGLGGGDPPRFPGCRCTLDWRVID